MAVVFMVFYAVGDAGGGNPALLFSRWNLAGTLEGGVRHVNPARYRNGIVGSVIH
jgi:hypothetical protein